jgi:hypothetical protein
MEAFVRESGKLPNPGTKWENSHEILRTHRSLLRNWEQEINALPMLTRVLEDERLPREYREKLFLEEVNKAETRLNKLAENVELASAISYAALRVDALPKVNRSREQLGREDLKLELDGLPDEDVPARMQELARSSDRELAAMAVSAFGRRYLRSRGGKESILVALEHAAAEGSIEYGSVAEQDAAKAFLAGKGLVNRPGVALLNAGQMRLEALKDLLSTKARERELLAQQADRLETSQHQQRMARLRSGG